MWFFTCKWKCQELTICYYSFACSNFKSRYDHLILQHALVLRSIYQDNSMPVTILGHKDFRANTAVLGIREKAAKNDCLNTGSSTGAPWISLQYAVSNLNVVTLTCFCNALPGVVPWKNNKTSGADTWRNCRVYPLLCRGRYSLQGLDLL